MQKPPSVWVVALGPSVCLTARSCLVAALSAARVAANAVCQLGERLPLMVRPDTGWSVLVASVGNPLDWTESRWFRFCRASARSMRYARLALRGNSGEERGANSSSANGSQVTLGRAAFV